MVLYFYLENDKMMLTVLVLVNVGDKRTFKMMSQPLCTVCNVPIFRYVKECNGI
jgi:hypothetical protein